MSDVYVFAGVFEHFRDTCLAHYGLDLAYFDTLPHFAWDAMLNNSTIKLDQLSYLVTNQMIESCARGGMCQVSRTHIQSHNKHMTRYHVYTVSSYIM